MDANDGRGLAHRAAGQKNAAAENVVGALNVLGAIATDNGENYARPPTATSATVHVERSIPSTQTLLGHLKRRKLMLARLVADGGD